MSRETRIALWYVQGERVCARCGEAVYDSPLHGLVHVIGVDGSDHRAEATTGE